MSSTQYYVAQTLDGYIADIDGGHDSLLGYDGESRIDVARAVQDVCDRQAVVGRAAVRGARYVVLSIRLWSFGPSRGSPRPSMTTHKGIKVEAD